MSTKSRYQCEFGKAKGHGYAKAHALAYCILTGQITGTDDQITDKRKALLKEYRSTGENMLEFFWRKNYYLSEINEIWSSCFNGSQKDAYSVVFDETLEKTWKDAWSRKNRRVANISYND